jgi:hypothetical protein
VGQERARGSVRGSGERLVPHCVACLGVAWPSRRAQILRSGLSGTQETSVSLKRSITANVLFVNAAMHHVPRNPACGTHGVPRRQDQSILLRAMLVSQSHSSVLCSNVQINAMCIESKNERSVCVLMSRGPVCHALTCLAHARAPRVQAARLRCAIYCMSVCVCCVCVCVCSGVRVYVCALVMHRVRACENKGRAE